MAGGHPRERTSLIVTVLNEAATIDVLLSSIAAQTQPPDEVIVVDGGSSDGTWQRLQDWQDRLPLQVIQAPGASIARGRNLAIATATGELVAVTDAGVRLERAWLAELSAALTVETDVVGGFFQPEVTTTFERAMGATVLPTLQDVRPAAFLPSSRSLLLRRAAWADVGGYPEWLDYCEDLVFDLALRRAGYRFAFAPAAIAWFRPRGSVRAFVRQYFLYARGDGKAGLWLTRHAIRYATYLAATLLVTRRQPWAWLLLLSGAAAYTRRPYARLQPHLAGLPAAERASAMALVPLVRLVGDVAKMLGYPVGVLWRFRTRWICRSSS
ncbi:MAG TPA: glycosyltransferase [Chloroflexota bacterium]|nr:glycosyltransferase [Chloroflexota bacterium]